MNPWPFVAASYTVAILLVLSLTLWAWLGMRRAERAAEELTRR